MGFWSKIGLASKQQLDEHTLNQTTQLEGLKKLIIESNKVNQELTKALIGEVVEKLELLEQNFIHKLEESQIKTTQELLQSTQNLLTHVSTLDELREKALREELNAIKENMALLEEVLKLNWANQLLNQLETNIEEYEFQKASR